MHKRIPSPATLLAGLALFVALGGTSIAAVSFAKRAGAVDGKSAVSASATLEQAAGKLVATRKSGPTAGKIPSHFVGGVPRVEPFQILLAPPDNGPAATGAIGVNVPDVGTVTVSCKDDELTETLIVPQATLTFNNTTPGVVEFASRVGKEEPLVRGAAAGALENVQVVPGSTTFELDSFANATHRRIVGVVRQVDASSPTAKCLVYGTVSLVK